MMHMRCVIGFRRNRRYLSKFGGVTPTLKSAMVFLSEEEALSYLATLRRNRPEMRLREATIKPLLSPKPPMIESVGEVIERGQLPTEDEMEFTW